LLRSVSAGQSFEIVGLAAGEVVSVQGNQSFSFTLSPAPVPDPPAPTTTTTVPVTTTTVPAATTTTTTLAPHDPCFDVTSCDPIDAYIARWRCNIPACVGPDWVGAVIDWPAWSAYASNDRLGNQSRSVYSVQGQALHPYMGAWADGCKVTSLSGRVLIIEWERGTDVWRETHLNPGQSHVIDLVGPENGALIESNYPEDFAVRIENCTPQPLPGS
jgi:hypothetical protein